MNRPMDFIKPFSKLSKDDASIAGGKGASLGEMTQAGIPVPPELGIPCIIGTKVATHILHDDDLVEVDADNGVVRIITQSEPITKLPVNTDSLIRFLEGTFNGAYLYSSIFGEYYKKLKCKIIYRQGFWGAYFPSQELARTHEEAISLFHSEREFNSWVLEIERHLQKFIGIQDFKNHQISLEKGFENLVFYLIDFFRLYSKTEFFYTDAVAKESDAQVQARLKKLMEIKQKARLILNQLAFEKENLLKKTLSAIEREHGVSIDDLYFYDWKELLELIKKGNGVISSELEKRKTAFAMQENNKELVVSSGDEAAEHIRGIKRRNIGTTNVLFGDSASKGTVSARVFLVPPNAESMFLNVSEYERRMKRGDVLVAEMTGPEIMLLCKKAGAIVTNQRGLLSHAAIIAREMGIPCIVGTEIATHVLHDGDLVEVDADSGVVKILEREESARRDK